MQRLFAAIRFLTILPVPGTCGTATEDLAGSVPYFPVVGFVLGAVAAAVAWAIAPYAPPMVAAAILVILLLTFSGCLHMDGLSDTADGFLSSRTRERTLEIMKDSHVGSMGVVAIAGVLLLKFASLASLDPATLWPAALLTPLAGRCIIVVQMALLPYARPEGLAKVFYRQKPRFAAIWAVGLFALVAWSVLQWRGIAVCGASIAVAVLFAVYTRHKIGGATGDTFGAACEIVEIVPALTLALWPIQVVR
jgi:adenosylcobinamide-GDP ribazoletransferase